MILVYANRYTTRLHYSLHLVLETVLRLPYRLTMDSEEFIASDLPKINYSDTLLNSGVFIRTSPLLFQTTLETIQPGIIQFNEIPCFFPVSDDSDLPFDVFAAAFFVATRYEEYLPHTCDQHGRFPASASILSKSEIVKKPVVHLWAGILSNALRKHYPKISIPKTPFQFEMTIDVDNAWAYRYKPFWIQAGTLIKSLIKFDFVEFHNRIAVLSGKQPDPYDTFQFIKKSLKKSEQSLRFFFLLGDRSQYDKNISHEHPALIHLIRQLAQRFPVGIHPSYESNQKPEKVEMEIERLFKITGKATESSRQHFLILKFPSTYHHLIELGIRHDYTMGFPEMPGFRAGMCVPFPFFNLEKNELTPLVIHPLHLMDGSLKNYLHHSPKQAIRESLELMQEVKAVGGTFSCLWHNESLSNYGEWKNWQAVFSEIVKTGITWQNESPRH